MLIYTNPDVVAHVLATLTHDEAAILAQNAALEAQLAANQAKLEQIAFFRQFASNVQSGAIYGMVFIPAPVPPALDSATPLEPGITVQ